MSSLFTMSVPLMGSAVRAEIILDDCLYDENEIIRILHPLQLGNTIPLRHQLRLQQLIIFIYRLSLPSTTLSENHGVGESNDDLLQQLSRFLHPIESDSSSLVSRVWLRQFLFSILLQIYLLYPPAMESSITLLYSMWMKQAVEQQPLEPPQQQEEEEDSKEYSLEVSAAEDEDNDDDDDIDEDSEDEYQEDNDDDNDNEEQQEEGDDDTNDEQQLQYFINDQPRNEDIRRLLFRMQQQYQSPQPSSSQIDTADKFEMLMVLRTVLRDILKVQWLISIAKIPQKKPPQGRRQVQQPKLSLQYIAQTASTNAKYQWTHFQQKCKELLGYEACSFVEWINDGGNHSYTRLPKFISSFLYTVHDLMWILEINVLNPTFSIDTKQVSRNQGKVVIAWLEHMFNATMKQGFDIPKVTDAIHRFIAIHTDLHFTSRHLTDHQVQQYTLRALQQLIDIVQCTHPLINDKYAKHAPKPTPDTSSLSSSSSATAATAAHPALSSSFEDTIHISDKKGKKTKWIHTPFNKDLAPLYSTSDFNSLMSCLNTVLYSATKWEVYDFKINTNKPFLRYVSEFAFLTQETTKILCGEQRTIVKAVRFHMQRQKLHQQYMEQQEQQEQQQLLEEQLGQPEQEQQWQSEEQPEEQLGQPEQYPLDPTTMVEIPSIISTTMATVVRFILFFRIDKIQHENLPFGILHSDTVGSIGRQPASNIIGALSTYLDTVQWVSQFIDLELTTSGSSDRTRDDDDGVDDDNDNDDDDDESRPRMSSRSQKGKTTRPVLSNRKRAREATTTTVTQTSAKEKKQKK